MKWLGKPGGFYYPSHQMTDPGHGMTVTSGDVHDSQPYWEQLEHVHKHVAPLMTTAADSAYDFLLAHRALEELGTDFLPHLTHDRTKAEFKRDVFT